jgi:protein tyrosine/serine phosphatase
MRSTFVGISIISAFFLPVVLPAQQNPTLFTCFGPSSGSSVNLWEIKDREVKDRSKPVPVHLKWTVGPQCPGNAVFDVYLSKTEHFTENDLISTDTSSTDVSVTNLEIGTLYFWQVVTREKGNVLYRGPIWRFQTSPVPPRWIDINGVTNVRDMGGWITQDGYKIKQGLLYRGAAMNKEGEMFITPTGIDTFVRRLHIKTDLDFRGAYEKKVVPAIDTTTVKWIKISISPYADIVSSGETGKKAYRKVFHQLAEPGNYPIYMHCQIGADRMGTVAFLVGALLNMRNEDLFRNYDLTSFSLSGIRDHNSEMFQGLLKVVSAYGKENDSLQRKVYYYLLDIGVTGEEIQSIYYILTGAKFILH